LNQPVVLITGGTTGIGLATARLFQERGYLVAAGCFGTAPEAPGILAIAADIRIPAQVDALIARTVGAFGTLDVLVNCASVTGTPALSPFLESPPDFLDTVIDTNLKGTILVSQAAARWMTAAKRPGCIIHVASVGAAAPQRNASVYCSTKAAQVMLASAMALELAPFGIRVNSVSPGDIRTDASADIEAEAVIPLGRRGRPEEIARAIWFLASGESAYMTGTNVTVDGGFLLV
jgi:3-oxoacyl-[acyl-carrier protein] reductase